MHGPRTKYENVRRSYVPLLLPAFSCLALLRASLRAEGNRADRGSVLDIFGFCVLETEEKDSRVVGQHRLELCL